MAAFNKSENQPVIQSGFITSSRGYQGNESLGELFKGLANTVNNTLTAADESLKAQADIDAFDLVEQTATESMPSETMPPEATSAVSDVQNLQGARTQGAMSNLEFQTRVVNRVKAARSRLPKGYHPIFERAVAGALGASTANDLRKTRLQEIESGMANADAEVKAKKSFFEKEIEFFGDPNVQSEYKRLTGKELTPGDLNYDYPAAAASVAKEKASRLGLEAKSKQASFRKEETESYFREKVTKEVNGLFNATNLRYDKFYKVMEQASKEEGPGGKDWTPEEAQQVTELFGQLSTEARSRTIAAINEDDNAANLDGPARESILKITEDTLNLYQEALTNKDFGTLSSYAREISYIQQSEQAKILRDNPIIKRRQALQQLGVSPVEIQAYTISDVQYKNAQEAELGKALTEVVITGQIPEAEAYKDNTTPSTTRNSITNVGRILNADLPADKIAKIGDKIFSKENEAFLKSLPQENRMQVFKQRVTPKVYEALKKTDPEAAKRMTRWATVQFPAIADQAFRTLYDTQKAGDNLELTFDGEQFQSNRIRGNVRDPVNQLNLYRMYEEYKVSTAEKARYDINSWISIMKPMWADQGISVKDGVEQSFENIDINNVAKEGSVFLRMNEALKTFVSEIGQPTEGQGDTSPPKVAPQNKDPRQESMTGKSIINYANKGATRKLDLTNELEGKIENAVTTVFGPGYQVEVFSGGQPKRGSGGKRVGSIRHDEGKAADVYIVGPDGKRVTDKKELDKLKNYWLENDMGSVGAYMRGAGVHLDEWTKEELVRGMASSWKY